MSSSSGYRAPKRRRSSLSPSAAAATMAPNTRSAAAVATKRGPANGQLRSAVTIKIRRIEMTDENNKMTEKQCEKSPNSAKARVCGVVERILNEGLKAKQAELQLIEQRLALIQKALKTIRYGTVQRYYGEARGKASPSSPGNDTLSIHPATRKLLAGKAPKEVKTEKMCDEAATKAVSTPREVSDESLMLDLPLPSELSIPPRDSDQERFKQRFIVGNVSKWIECDQREDLATHKWMMYVRGDAARPDVSDLVSHVRFLIHPSYHPHDLIEVRDSPFHLTRRGWGEFPARVQIHFKDRRDKPVDVIHHLKLDKTYTGSQTLGSETIVDVWLHNPEHKKEEELEDESLFSSSSILGGAKAYQLVDTAEGWVICHADSKIPGLQNTTTNLETRSISLSQAASTETVSETAPTTMTKATLDNDNDRIKKVLSCLERENVMLNGSAQKRQHPGPTYVRCKDKAGEIYYLPIKVLPQNHKKAIAMPPDLDLSTAPAKPMMMPKAMRRIHPQFQKLTAKNGSVRVKSSKVLNNRTPTTITRMEAIMCGDAKNTNHDHYQQPIHNLAREMKNSSFSVSLIQNSSRSAPASQFSSPLGSPHSSPAVSRSSSPQPLSGRSLLKSSNNLLLKPGTSLLKQQQQQHIESYPLSSFQSESEKASLH